MKKALKIVALIITVTIAVVATMTLWTPEVVTVERSSSVPENVIETVTNMVEDIDEVTEAERMLREATEKLDAEEERLNGEIEVLEARVAEINRIRSSF